MIAVSAKYFEEAKVTGTDFLPMLQDKTLPSTNTEEVCYVSRMLCHHITAMVGDIFCTFSW
jgi:hypothetical protein